ncbi:MAG: AAA family ATPase [Chloroflexi bacterium]|nr:AAA family ATPase [Chloroflexota bacterium]
MTWSRCAKIAFIGSHGIRKTTAAHGFATTVQRAGRSVEFAREVVRDNPLGINESATGEAQLWVLMSQVRQELELASKAQVLVTDRAAMDNHAYYLRACAGIDRFAVTPLVTAWAATYDLVVRLLPDVSLRADGTRSTTDTFRDEVEAILDETLPRMVPESRIVVMRASDVREGTDWWPLAERLAALLGEPLRAPGVEAPRPRRTRSRARTEAATGSAATANAPQLRLDLDGSNA